MGFSQKPQKEALVIFTLRLGRAVKKLVNHTHISFFLSLSLLLMLLSLR